MLQRKKETDSIKTICWVLKNYKTKLNKNLSNLTFLLIGI
jgi:hypothetical protein